MSLAFRRLERRARTVSDDWRTPTAALPLLREFTVSHPSDEDGWTLLAATLHDLERNTEAEQVATNALEALPFQHMPLWELLLDVLIARREFDRADALAEVERDDDPDAAWPWERLAWIAWQRGDASAWEKRAEQAWIRLRDHTDLGMLRLAETYAASDHPEAFLRTTFLLDRVGAHVSSEEGWRANLALGVLWEALDEPLSQRYFDRAARYPDADPIEEEEVLVGYMSLLESLRTSVGEDELEGVMGTDGTPPEPGLPSTSGSPIQ